MEEISYKTPTPSILGGKVAEVERSSEGTGAGAGGGDGGIDNTTNINTHINGGTMSDGHCVVLGEKKDLSLLKIQMPPPQYSYSPQHGQQQLGPRQHQILISGGSGGMESASPKGRTSSGVTLPSHVAIPVGLAQVFVGGSMVICGSFALRYQSYLFYYGSGLWAGTLAGIAGILAVMATKKGLPKPKWLCGGRRWQIHIFLAAVMLSLSTAILAAIFSTSGLVRDTQHDFSKSVNDMTPDEEMFEKRKSSGIAINAMLLLLALLQILLSFCSLGIALRVICSNNYCHNGSLLSSGSDGSEVTVREILGNGTGPEYEARKDRLLRWLGHQRRNFFVSLSPKGVINAKNVASSIHSNSKLGGMNRTIDPRFYHPRFVAVQPTTFMHPCGPPGSLPYVIPAPLPPGPPTTIITTTGPHSLPSHPFPYPQPLMVPIIPLPIRQQRPHTPNSLASSEKQRRRRRGGGGHSTSGSSVGGKSRRSSSVPRTRRSEEKNKEVEITEEEVGRTYTGLDRTVAEDFISNTMSSH